MQSHYLTKCLELAADVPEFFDRPTALHWRRLEEELGLVFPESHKEFVNAFGSGYFGPFQLWNPAGKGRFEFSKAVLLETNENCLALSDMDVRIFPEVDGLVFVADGTTSNLFALAPEGKALRPELIEVDYGGHLVRPTGFEIAEFHFREYTEGRQGNPPQHDDPSDPFFSPIQS